MLPLSAALLLGGAPGLGSVGLGSVGLGPGVAVAGDRSAADATARWLAARLSPEGTYENPLGGELPDHGLMIDALFAMHASDDAALAAPIVDHLDGGGHASDYFTWDGLVPGQGYDAIIVGGAAAKVLVAAEVSGRDPRSFDGYDMVAETEAAIRRSGPDKGRVSDYSKNPDFADFVSNNANVFGQALAVIGLAAVGRNDPLAIDTLLTQQCSEGFFRIFFEYIPTDEVGEHVTPTGHKVSTCDEGKAFDKSSPDGDTTGLALSAMTAAREAGAGGLDEPISRAVGWLRAAQDPTGGWGGGVGTEGPNTNSTGLVVQALAAAGGAGAEVGRGVAFLRSAQVTEADAGTALAGDLGAIAYDPAQYRAARTTGIVGVDTWIRSGAQASLGLARVPFHDLARRRVPPDEPPATPPPTTDPPATDPPAGAAPPPAAPPVHRPGNPAPPPGSSRGVPVTPPTTSAEPGTATPAGRLGAHLAGRLVGGDHVEVAQDGTTFVDYDATADVVLALRTLGEQDEAVQRATRFLLQPASVDAYARGVPYEQGAAAYAEPLAKLLLIARFDQAEHADPVGGADGPEGREGRAALVDRISADLAALRTADGRFADTGSFADSDESVRRQAWLIAATVAGSSADDAAPAVDRLVRARCADGLFPVDLGGGECAAGDVAATAAAVTALNLRPRDGAAAGRAVPGDWSPERAAALVGAVRALDGVTGEDGVVVDGDGDADIARSSAVAAARQAVGLDVGATARALGALLLPDGGVPGPGSAPGTGDVPDNAALPDAEDVTGAGNRAVDGGSDLAAGVAAAPGVAGRSWIDADGSPVAAAVRLPLHEQGKDPATAPQVVTGARAVTGVGAAPVWALAALGAVGVAGSLVLLVRRVKTRKNNTMGVTP
ncbi:hypothetical protein [Saccharothrix algeriensis]|uniref:Squalene cyclase C-terminal domain-containing protein n=3 Tax=Saccharothrix algeriensis TaxID=173560 RepID=A0ABS2SFF2_9PSEU|nr:hypothetical protein [Saccharothrix algeriensis]MBM7814963.1 hypothetical protein [Saccharothrix algeriensis]